jgi:hypothetical protein
MCSRLLPLFVLALLCGCGGSRTSPVKGVVLLDGRPLANASVQFVPDGSGRDATGATNNQGEFVMSTFDPRDGVAPGTYKIVISPPIGEVDTTRYESSGDAMTAATKPRPTPKSTFPQRYTSASQTPLRQEVPLREPLLKIELTTN